MYSYYTVEYREECNKENKIGTELIPEAAEKYEEKQIRTYMR